jgi:Domain of unknown function (DUF4281)
MSPDTMFQVVNPLALLGWVALALSPLAPRAAGLVAGWVIPLTLSVGYTALVLVHFAGAEGGFGNLPEVMALFGNPWLVLAGWVHYLAFDLFVGAWITRTARHEAVPHLLVLPCLALTFLFGPAGLLTFAALRATRGQIAPQTHEATA